MTPFIRAIPFSPQRASPKLIVIWLERCTTPSSISLLLSVWLERWKDSIQLEVNILKPVCVIMENHFTTHWEHHALLLISRIVFTASALHVLYNYGIACSCGYESCSISLRVYRITAATDFMTGIKPSTFSHQIQWFIMYNITNISRAVSNASGCKELWLFSQSKQSLAHHRSISKPAETRMT